jgi:hypothetical protein
MIIWAAQQPVKLIMAPQIMQAVQLASWQWLNFFKQHPHPYSLIFAFFDREESGEEGSAYFVNDATSSEH